MMTITNSIIHVLPTHYDRLCGVFAHLAMSDDAIQAEDDGMVTVTVGWDDLTAEVRNARTVTLDPESRTGVVVLSTCRGSAPTHPNDERPYDKMDEN